MQYLLWCLGYIALASASPDEFTSLHGSEIILENENIQGQCILWETWRTRPNPGWTRKRYAASMTKESG